MKHLVALFALEGVPDAEVSTPPITTADGLSMLRFRHREHGDPTPGRDVVMIDENEPVGAS